MDKPDCHIDAIRYRVGELLPISTLRPLQEEPGLLDMLSSMGLKDYSRIEAREYEGLITSCLAGTLEAWRAGGGSEGGRIEALVYASTSMAQFTLKAATRILDRLGLPRAMPYGITFGVCANFVHALDAATGLMASKGYRNVLVLISDCVEEDKFPRLLPPNAGVASDSVVSFVLSTERPAGFRLELTATDFDGGIDRIQEEGNFIEFVQRFAGGFEDVVKSALARAGLEPGGVKRLLTGNYNMQILRNFAKIAGFRKEHLHLENLAAYSHCLAGDQFISLADLDGLGECLPGDKYLMVGVGDNIWGAAVVEKASGRPRTLRAPAA